MAGWQSLLAIFSVVLVSVSAFPSPNVKENEGIDPMSAGLPRLLKVDTNDEEFQTAAEFALEEMSKRGNHVYKILQYMNADVQVLQGSMYIFDVVLGKTDCPLLNYGNKPQKCSVIQAVGQSEFFLCHLITWKTPSFARQRVLRSKCQKINL